MSLFPRDSEPQSAFNPQKLSALFRQKEYAEESIALRDFLRGDPLLRRFFEHFFSKKSRPKTGKRCGLPEGSGTGLHLRLCLPYLGTKSGPGFVEMTVPERPTSSKQKYRLKKLTFQDQTLSVVPVAFHFREVLCQPDHLHGIAELVIIPRIQDDVPVI